MKSERFKCQVFIENEVGCNDVSQLHNYKVQIENYTLTTDKVGLLRNESFDDACSLNYKAVVSLLEAIYGLINGHSSWAIVKLYYSTFYSLRALLFLNGFVTIKDGKGNIFILKNKNGSKPEKATSKSIKGDHKTTIHAFKKYMSSHKLNGNTIDGDGTCVFEWLMSHRELVNYRMNSFIEPSYADDVLPRLGRSCDEFDSVLSKYINNNDYAYCFLSDHSILSTPVALAFLVKNEADGLHVDLYDEDEIKLINSIIKKCGLSRSRTLSSIFK